MAHTALEVLAKLRDAFLALDEFAEAGGFDELNKPTASKPAPAAKKTASRKPAPEPEPEDDDTDDATETELPSKEELAVMGIKELRALAVALDLEEQKTKAGILAEIESMRDEDDDAEDYEDEEDEAEDDDYEDEDAADEGDDEDDEDAEEDDAYTREELEGMDLKTLRSVAKSEGVPVAEYRGADKDKLVDLILGLDAEDEGDDDPEADEDDDEGALTEEDIKKMTVAQLTELAAELDITIPRRVAGNKDAKAKKTALVQLIMDTAEDE